MDWELPRCPWPTDALYLGLVNDHLVGCFRHREISRHAGAGKNRTQPHKPSTKSVPNA
jgi:hypothetical protein